MSMNAVPQKLNAWLSARLTLDAPWRWLLALSLFLVAKSPSQEPEAPGIRVGTFRADVTIPVGHRCMGILPRKAEEILDPLEARGLVVLGSGQPLVFCAVDWCEIRNDAYDAWRDGLALAAGTVRERVLLSSVHQHDAPVTDLGAEELLAEVGLKGELCDTNFHAQAIERVKTALRSGIATSIPVTHLGLGASKVERVASNRRVKLDGRITFSRGSASGGSPPMSGAPEGRIDPWLRMLSFWNGETPVAALSVYATHPMSHYGQGQISADFVGMARRAMQNAHPSVFQIYASGASGDVTAGKYNDGSLTNRPALASRLYEAMERAWTQTQKKPIESLAFRNIQISLPFLDDPAFGMDSLRNTLQDSRAAIRERILAAMALSTRNRLQAGNLIDIPCVDFGDSLVVLLPGEAFVGYQQMIQSLRPDTFVIAIGYGECWPGYIPTPSAFGDGFGTDWRWVAPPAARILREALWKVVRSPAANENGPVRAGKSFSLDLFPATDNYPRYSEGSIAVLTQGDLFFATTEFGGNGSDFSGARIVARRSEDEGFTWSEKRVLQENIGQLNVMSASLLPFVSAERGGLGLFYLVKNSARDLNVWMRFSDDQGWSFGPPEQVTKGSGYHVMNNDRVVQLLSGRIVCPIAWTSDVQTANHFVSTCYFSDDGGLTWTRSNGEVDLPARGAMEPEVIELQDGRLLMLIRTQLGHIYRAYSPDQGDTWTKPESTGVPSPEAPCTVRRIPSTGDLLLIWNPEPAPGSSHGGPRTPLAAAISRDEGKTWTPHLALENRTDQTYAYTSLTFHGNRALMSYYVRAEATGKISTRFRSLPIGWFY